ncbi:MAG: flagellin [Clostridium sp.]|nr:flagellin [Clostridium sp.]
MNVITHNLSAMNANRQFNIVNRKKAKSTEKLSSGYKINRAADDAAGLAIAEKMRRQIRGLRKAAENIQDGISLCQVADGALNEVHDILQRMNELSVKAGNDTNSQEDRSYIQAEIDALTEEVDRIANQTTFNEEIYPLLGATKTGGIEDIANAKLPPYLMIRKFSVVNTTGQPIIWDGVTYNVGDTVKGSYMLYDAYLDPNSTWPEMVIWHISEELGKGGWSWIGSGSRQHCSLEELDKQVLESEAKNQSTKHGYGGVSIVDWAIDTDRSIYFKLHHVVSYSCDEFWYWRSPDGNGSGCGWVRSDDTEYFKLPNDGTANAGNNNMQSDLWIHMATEPGVGMYINLVNATAKGIGIDNLDVSSMENAGNAINSIKGALETISKYRTVFGAQQNRLEHAININENIAENTTDAESRIRDVDVAKEMVLFSNGSILAQAGQSMLVQANQSQQYILSLLS